MSDTFRCYECGRVYDNGDICPECGCPASYTLNEDVDEDAYDEEFGDYEELDDYEDLEDEDDDEIDELVDDLVGEIDEDAVDEDAVDEEKED